MIKTCKLSTNPKKSAVWISLHTSTPGAHSKWSESDYANWACPQYGTLALPLRNCSDLLFSQMPLWVRSSVHQWDRAVRTRRLQWWDPVLLGDSAVLFSKSLVSVVPLGFFEHREVFVCGYTLAECSIPSHLPPHWPEMIPPFTKHPKDTSPH